MDAECLQIAPDRLDTPVGQPATECRTARCPKHHPRVDDDVGSVREVHRARPEDLVDNRRFDLDCRHASPAGILHLFVAVLLGLQPHGGGLDPHRQVFADQHHISTLMRVVQGDRKDPGVVVAQPETGGQPVDVGVIQLDAQVAAFRVDADQIVEPAIGLA